uniref:TOG domain-containing protein n=3 Tax=Rhizophora mucronata TaxID=61149 RepID=A0A2P2K8L4_RHIMU
MTSDDALRDLNNTLPGSERNNQIFIKGSFAKTFNGNTAENGEEQQRKKAVPLVSTAVNGTETVNSGVEAANSEVEYIESENLHDVEDVDASVKTLLIGLDSKDWVQACDSLNNVRRLSIYHKEVMLDMLGDVISLIVKSLKNPRSAVCKTAIMASADIFHAYNDCIIDSLDPLLVQLLLKSSQDKRFVCEAAERALVAMTTWVSSTILLPKLEPYLKNRNPRVRAKASMCFCRSVAQLGVEGIKVYGIDKLIQVAASQLSDRLPESREAARTLLLELQSVYEKSHDLSPTVSGHPEMSSWEHFCQSKLSPLSAQAVLRVTNIAREGLVLGS